MFHYSLKLHKAKETLYLLHTPSRDSSVTPYTSLPSLVWPLRDLEQALCRFSEWMNKRLHKSTIFLPPLHQSQKSSKAWSRQTVCHQSGQCFILFWCVTCLLQVQHSQERIDIERLKVRDKILFYADVELYEDELHDCGCSMLSVKIVSEA